MPELYTGDPFGRRARFPILLFALPIPLVFSAFTALTAGLGGAAVVRFALFVVFMLAAALMRRGLTAELDYARRTVARPPALPRKTLAVVLVGLGTAASAYLAAGHDILTSSVFGVGALAGAFLTYGLDPRAEKRPATAQNVSTAELEGALLEAEGKIAAIDAARREIRNPELAERLGRIVTIARRIVAAIAEDPGDLRRMRKFLHVYLDGACDVAEKYARTHRKTDMSMLEGNFRSVLQTIETTFADQHRKLMADDVQDLDVEIEVLKMRLKEEGVT